MIGRNGKGEIVFASNISGEKFARALGKSLTRSLASPPAPWAIRPEPMPPWRARQHVAFLREAPEPIFWGRAFCASAWVLAFLAVALVAFEWGSFLGFKEAISIVVPPLGGLR